MKYRRNIFILFFIVHAVAGFVFSQKKSPKEKIEKKVEVKANLMVLNADNQLVGDIKAENVKIFEDGVEQKITYFAEKKNILNLGIVVDNSGSMRYSLDEIIWAGSYVAANLRENDEAFAIRFVDSDKIEILQDWTSNKSLFIEPFNNMYIEGGQSAVLDAIYLAAEKILERAKNDKTKRYAILMISDMEERDSFYNFNETVKLFKDTDSQLFILSYAEFAPRKRKFAKSLSHSLSLETGGTIYTLSKKHDREELKNALGKIIVELRSNYVIGYTPTNQKKDGLPRKLTVQVADDTSGNKRKSLIREEFVVPKN